jgi:transposase
MNTSEIFIGIDVSKTQLDVAVRPLNDAYQVPNTADGIATLVERLRPVVPTLITIEATGGYEREVAVALTQQNWAVAVVNPRHVRAFARALGQLAKTDQLDAAALAQFGEQVRPVARPPKPEDLQRLDALVTRRRQLITMRTMEFNRRHHAPLAVQASLDEHIAWLTTHIDALDAQLQALIEANPLWHHEATLLRGVNGVGPGFTQVLIARLPELGHIPSKQLSALVGVAPLNRDSGAARGRRTIWGGRTDVRTALYMSTITAIRCNSVIQAYYQHLRTAGKLPKVAITACMRKLLTILNAMIRDQREWDANFSQKGTRTS